MARHGRSTAIALVALGLIAAPAAGASPGARSATQFLTTASGLATKHNYGGSSRPFTVPSQARSWTVDWSYRCTQAQVFTYQVDAPGLAGYPASFLGPLSEGKTDSGSNTYLHGFGITYKLHIETQPNCHWAVSVLAGRARPADTGETLLSRSGTDQVAPRVVTPSFTIPTAAEGWHVDWSYDCASSPLGWGTFNWQVLSRSSVVGNDGGPNSQDVSGSGVQHYTDTGVFRLDLSIYSGCNWSVRVITGQ